MKNNVEFQVNPRRCPRCGHKNQNCKIRRVGPHIAVTNCQYGKVKTTEIVLRPSLR